MPSTVPTWSAAVEHRSPDGPRDVTLPRMSVRGWAGTLATAVGIAAATGAAQLGFGYGLGIISWTPPEPDGSVDTLWLAGLGWAVWIAATATIAGAVGARRLIRSPASGARAAGGPGGVPTALAAALGALVTVLLVAVPARVATPADTSVPQNVAAGYAAAGVLAGLLVALWAQWSPPAAVNIAASVGWLWLLAVIAVVDGVLAGQGMASVPLGVWQFTPDRPGFWLAGHFHWPAAVLSLGSALVIGALAARRAARSPYQRVGAAASGAAGPFLVAVAYLLTAPRLPEIRAEQLSAQLVAAYAVVAGLAGSVLVAALAQRRDRTVASAVDDPAADPTDAAAVPVDVADPTHDGAPTGSVAPADGGATVAPEAVAVDTPVPVDPGVDPPRRRAATSTSKVPRPRRREPSPDTGPAGSDTTPAAVEDPVLDGPEGTGHAGTTTVDPATPAPEAAPGGVPAAQPDTGPATRPRRRSAPRQPRD